MNPRSFPRPNGRFVDNRIGDIAFLPRMLPPNIRWDSELWDLWGAAQASVSELRGVGMLLEDPAMLIYASLRREAEMSSKIEGTQASLKDIFQYEVGCIRQNEFERLRLREVLNHVKVLKESLDAIDSKETITPDMIKRVHRQLLDGVRGQDMHPGSFRKVQNWIGRAGNDIRNSTYTPPPPEYLDELLENFVDFVKNPPAHMPVLIEASILKQIGRATIPACWK